MIRGVNENKRMREIRSNAGCALDMGTWNQRAIRSYQRVREGEEEKEWGNE